MYAVDFFQRPDILTCMKRGEKNMTHVVAALIRDGDRFMICRRPPHKTRGSLWEFAGGKVEAGETPREALIRECREELNVEVLPGSVFCELVHDYPDVTIKLTLFEAQILHGKPECLEHSDIRWIGVSEIDDYSFCPADGQILEMLKKRKNNAEEP